ncbi:MAG: hypothetical protein ACOY4R_08000 [Pseudomonadota bacterium]
MSNKSMLGVALYEPFTLGKVLRFLERNRDRLPLDQLLSAKFPLDQINEAFARADRQASFLEGNRRVATRGRDRKHLTHERKEAPICQARNPQSSPICIGHGSPR